MQAGALRHRVAIKLPSTAVGDYGQRTGTDTTVAVVWAAIETLTGREAEQARQLYASATLRVTLRYRSDLALTTKHYLTFGTRTIHIAHIDQRDQRKDTWVLLCGEDK